MKKIAIDIDDTLADSLDVFIKKINERSSKQLAPEHYQAPYGYWGYHERVLKSHGIDIDPEEIYAEIAIDQSRYPLLAGAEYAVGELAKKFEITLITSREPAAEAATIKWLKQALPNLDIKLLFAKNNVVGTGTKTKGQICKELGISLLIDDNPEHCISALDSGVSAILFGNYGWHHDAPQHLVRCADWPAVLDYINEQT